MGYLQRKHTKDQKYEINRLEMEMRDASAAYERKNADKPDKQFKSSICYFSTPLTFYFKNQDESGDSIPI